MEADKVELAQQQEKNSSHQFIYSNRAQQIKAKSLLRMGYPVTGPIHGHFTTFGWQRDEEDPHKLIDNELLGIKENSISDTLMINIGGRIKQSTIIKSGAWEQEDQILSIFAQYYKAPENSLRGYVTTGGTEANEACLWWLRDYLKQKNKQQMQAVSHSSIEPRAICSVAAHYSIPKSFDILNIENEIIPANSNGEMDLTALSTLLKQHMKDFPRRPLIIVATIGTTLLGAIDDIPKIKLLLDELVISQGSHCALHVDGASLGAVLPLINPFQTDQSIFEFADTFTISGHKYFGTTVICGVALTKHHIVKTAFENKNINVSYVNDIQDMTITGSRSGLMVMELHNALFSLDIPTDALRMEKVVNQCQTNACYLYENLKILLGADHVFKNRHNFVITFKNPLSKEIDLENKYGLMKVDADRLCIWITAAVSQQLINQFLQDMALCVNKTFLPPERPISPRPFAGNFFSNTRMCPNNTDVVGENFQSELLI